MFRSFWATSAVIFSMSSIQVRLASASPTQNLQSLGLPQLHERMNRLEGRAPPSPHRELPLLSQATAWATLQSPGQDAKDGNGANPTYKLPPVAVVFKMVADTETSLRVASKSAKVPTPAPMVAAALVPTETTTRSPPESTEQPRSEHTPYLAPGLVVVSTSTAISEQPVIYPSTNPQPTQPSLPPVAQATDSSTPGPNVTPSTAGLQRNGAPARKLAVFGGIMAGLIVLLFIVYMFFDQHVFACCKRTTRKDKPEQWTKITSPPPPTRSFNEHMEKFDNAVYTPPWKQLFNSSYSNQGSPSPETKPLSFDPVSASDYESTAVMDISSSYPRSKFSVCSSEYPASSLASTTRASAASLVSGSRYSSSAESPTPSNKYRSPQLPAYEFFCIPLSESEDNHHMRAHSAPMPIFGHNALSDSPGVMVRSLDHRKSRSVSGLTYTVQPSNVRGSACGSEQSGSEMESQRGSGSSAGGDHWRAIPVNGWPSAL